MPHPPFLHPLTVGALGLVHADGTVVPLWLVQFQVHWIVRCHSLNWKSFLVYFT